jgi:hypothetical protein
MQSGVGPSAEVYDLLSFKEHEERASAKTAFSVPLRSTATAAAASLGIDYRDKGEGGRGGGGEREGQGQEHGEWQGEYEGRGEGQGEGSAGLEDNALCMMHSSLSGSRSSFSTGKPHPSLTRTGSSRSPSKAVPYTNFADGCPKGLLSSMCFQQLQLDRNKERVREKVRAGEREKENAMIVVGVAGVVSKKAISVDDRGKHQDMDIQYEKKVKLKMKEDKLEDEKDIDRKSKKELEMERDKEKSRAREVEKYREEMSRQRGVWAALASTGGIIGDIDRDRGAGASQQETYTTAPPLTSSSRVEDEMERERERDLMPLSSPIATTTPTTTGAGYLLNARARQSEKEKEAEVDDRSGWKRDRETLFSSRKDENMLASSMYDKRSGKEEEGRNQDRDGVEVNEKEGNEEDKMSAYLLHLQSMNQRTDTPIERRRSSQFPTSSSTAPTTTTTGTSTGRGSLLVPQGIVYIPPNLYGTPLRASQHCQAAIFLSHNDGAREHVSESDQHYSRSSKTDVENEVGEVEKDEEDNTDARIREWRRSKLEKEYLERELREGGGVREGEGGKYHSTAGVGAGMSYDPTRYGVRLPGGTMAWNTSLRETVPVSTRSRISSSGCGTLDSHSLNSTMKSKYYISNSPPPSPPASPPRPSLSPSPSPTPSSPLRSNGCSEERNSAGVWRNPFAALLVAEQAQGAGTGARGGAGVITGSPLPSASSSSSSSFSAGTSPSPAERNGKRLTPVQRKTCSPSPPPPAPAPPHSSPSYSLRFTSPSNRHFSPPPSRIILPSFPSSSPSYNSSPSPSPSIRSAEVVAGGEKGWIPHTNKGYTHNVPLNHACAHAMATRMVRTDLLALLPSLVSLFLSFLFSFLNFILYSTLLYSTLLLCIAQYSSNNTTTNEYDMTLYGIM